VAGDAAAFDMLVRRYRRRVFGICLQYFGDPRDAEDATQDAFIALLRRASTFAGTAAFSTWMYRVAINACNDLARKRARRPRSSAEDPAALADVATLDDVLANRELGVELEAALRRLDPIYREAVVLHDVIGLPQAEIADRTGVAVGTVKSRIHRGHAQLASALTHLREPSDSSTPPTVQP
jgi:RNA polymerase sigma-70 factor, ECF subfamily